MLRKPADPIDRTTDLSNYDQYTNMSIYNPYDATSALQAAYTEQRTQNLVGGNPQHFKAAVLSVAIPTRSIPLFIWDNFKPDGVTYKYTVTLALYHNIAYTNPIISQKGCLYTPFSSQDGINGNLPYVYLYNQIVLSINKAYIEAYLDIKSQYQTVQAWDNSLPQYPPKMVYDTSLEKFYIKADYRMNTSSDDPEALYPTTVPYMQMSYSDTIDSLFFNFPGQAYEYGFNLTPFGRDQVIRIYDTGASNCLIKPDPLDSLTWYYQIYQQSSTKALISQVSKIIVTSNMPFRYENFNAINTLGTTAQLNIIADFDFSREGGEDDSYVLWSPSPSYKFMDILDANNFNFLDYTIYYQTLDGTIRQMYLFPGDSCSVKLLLEHK